MSEEYRDAWTERLWSEGLAKYKPLDELPRVDFVPADADPTDRFLALLHAMPTPSEFQSTFMPDPIPLSEREPGLEDCHCITNSTARDGAYVWAGIIIQSVGLNSFWNWDFVDRDYMIAHSASGRSATLYTHWLPASTKYLPARMEG